MFLEWLNDPTVWVGLLTLIILEVVLGIDNLVFIAVLADKLPEHQRAKARMMGLGLALAMRLVLLSMISWIVTLTNPLFTVASLEFSWRDIIMIVGGLFLLFKATMELHERIEGHHASGKGGVANAVFWQVLVQIVVLDAVFSLDSVITAVGMVKHLEIMVLAVMISMGIMVLMAKPLMIFVSRHPTVVVLCLAFLMMIGMSLLAEGFGFHIEKGYIYAAIGFAVLNELFNLLVRRGATRSVTTGDLRDKTATAVLAMLGARTQEVNLGETANSIVEQVEAGEVFTEEETDMVRSVLTLSDRSVRSIMSPRTEIDWIDVNSSQEELLETVVGTVHSRLLVCDGELENMVGVVSAKELLVGFHIEAAVDVRALAEVRQVLMMPDVSDVLAVKDKARVAPLQIAVIYDEHGAVTGIVTPTDILEAIAGEFPDEDETLSETPQAEEGTWVFSGWSGIETVSQSVDEDLSDPDENYTTINGFILFELGVKPDVGSKVESHGLVFEVLEMDNLVVKEVRITKAPTA